MWKYLNKGISTPLAIGIILILSIALGSYAFWQASEIEKLETGNYDVYLKDENDLSEEMSFLFSVKGCAETDRGMATKEEVGVAIEREPKVDLIGNKIEYSRLINHLCCRKAELKKEIKGDTINIFEFWTGIGCKCQCFSEISATLDNISSGTYTVNVYETGIKPGEDNEPMGQNLIISKEINITTKEINKKEILKNELTGWNIYKNVKYGYEIEYPPSYSEVRELSEGKEVTIRDNVMYYYGISVKENISSLDELKSLMEEKIKKEFSKVEIKWKNTTVFNEKAIEMSYENYAGGYTGTTHRTGVIKDSTAYIIVLINGSESEYYKILSTFKFID